MKSQNVSLLCVLCLCCCSALLLLPTLTTSLNLSSKSQGTRFVSSSSPSSYPSSRLNRTSKSNQRIDPRSTLSCHRREYTFKAIQTDSMGRSCYQYITAMTCWGRCDSGEVSLLSLSFFSSCSQLFGPSFLIHLSLNLSNMFVALFLDVFFENFDTFQRLF